MPPVPKNCWSPCAGVSGLPVRSVRGGAQQDPPHQVTRDTTADRPPHRPPPPGRGSGQKGTTSLQDTQAGGSLNLAPQQFWVQGPVSPECRGI
jgi:hypothetical protein